MTKAELVNAIANKLGTEKNETQRIVEAFMQEIRTTMCILEDLDLLLSKQEQRKRVEIFLKILQSRFLHTISQHLSLLRLS